MTTMEEIQLPDLVEPVVPYCCRILTSSPSCDDHDSNCRIMFIDGYSERCIMSCDPGDDHFVKHHFTIDLRIATYMNGKLYGLTMLSYGLVAADIMINSSSTSDPIIRFKTLTQVDESLSKTLPIFLTTSYLMECNGHLLLVLVTYFTPSEDVTGFRLFRADLEVWTEVKSIGDHHAIFLDRERAFSFPVAAYNSSIKGNCIYFTETEDRSLYTYSLEDQTITMTLPCHLSDTITASECDDHSVWILIPPLTNLYN